MIRYALQFNSTADVVRRTVILVLLIAICAGVVIRLVATNYFVDDPQGLVDSAYLVGAFAGVLIGWPIVMAFFFAAKYIYGVHKAVEKIAREDFLTGLLNRREFFSQIASTDTVPGQSPMITREGMLLIIDADNFKRINDNHGHLSGDKALIAIANAIEGGARNQDIVSRIGGEEFGVLVTDATHEIGAAVAANILLAVSDIKLSVENTELNLSVSIGAVRVTPRMAMSHAMKTADTALYRAKQTGKNRVVFGGMPDILSRVSERSDADGAIAHVGGHRAA